MPPNHALVARTFVWRPILPSFAQERRRLFAVRTWRFVRPSCKTSLQGSVPVRCRLCRKASQNVARCSLLHRILLAFVELRRYLHGFAILGPPPATALTIATFPHTAACVVFGSSRVGSVLLLTGHGTEYKAYGNTLCNCYAQLLMPIWSTALPHLKILSEEPFFLSVRSAKPLAKSTKKPRVVSSVATTRKSASR